MLQLSQLLLILLPFWIQACTTNDECQNGGVCELSWIATADESYTAPICNCLSGYWGFDCRDICDLKCENRGQCGFGTSSDHGGGDVSSGEIVCKCPQGFIGPLCILRENEDDAADFGARDDENPSSNTDPMTTSAGDDSSSRSGGAKFGIVLGVFLILGFIGVVLMRNRRRSSKKSTIEPSPSASATESIPDREFA